MQAIILAGGFGTRLQSVVSDVPKPMAPIHGKPFLAYLLDYLKKQYITEVVLSVHYKYEKIMDFFSNEYNGIAIRYAIEEQPLGTGGAIFHAMQSTGLSELSKPLFILNGDTFLKLDYKAMQHQHEVSGAVLTLGLRRIANAERYGVVSVNDNENRVTAFHERGQPHTPGLINAGVYLIQSDIFNSFHPPEKIFSFERDFLFSQIAALKPHAFIVEDYFIDIGIPEDYARAVIDFPKLIGFQGS